MAALNSGLFECQVYHQRLKPKRHAFRNRIFFFYLDLDELPQLHNRWKLFNIGQRAYYEFRESDHLPNGLAPSLKERAKAEFELHGLTTPIAKITVLAHMRTLGYVFNPISLFFAFDEHGRCLGSLAQVENTFREMKVFPILCPATQRDEWFESEHIKYFYVSPYSSLDQGFRFQVSAPQAEIHCQVSSLAQGDTVLDSGFHGKKHALSDGRLLALSLRYPLITWQVIALIHLHAILLWIKRLPLHLKEACLFDQRQVLRPRRDLKQYYTQQEIHP